MAGVKGRSGGPRPNSGGARPGAGRKPAPKPEPAVVPLSDPLEFLRHVMQGLIDPTEAQLKAAIAAVPYVHAKKGEGGKRDAQVAAAKTAAGRFTAAAAPPKLAAIGGKKV